MNTLNLRHLDIAIAEGLFGFKVNKTYGGLAFVCKPDGSRIKLPDYSTDGSAMLNVLDRLSFLEYAVYIDRPSQSDWHVTIYDRQMRESVATGGYLPIVVARAVVEMLSLPTDALEAAR